MTTSSILTVRVLLCVHVPKLMPMLLYHIILDYFSVRERVKVAGDCWTRI